jgi:hypothetical protein
MSTWDPRRFVVEGVITAWDPVTYVQLTCH